MKVVIILCFLSTTVLARYQYPEKIFESHDDDLKELLFKETSKNHKSQSYKGARRAIFNKLFLEEDGQGYFVRDLYCDVIKREGISPTSLPHHEVLNTEHLWPQMNFSYPYSNIQKTDLYHLMPVGHRANSHRGNLPFGEIEDKTELFEGCAASSRGPSIKYGNKRKFFEPPAEIKGDIARALFYFSVRYEEEIDNAEEFFLRKWHIEDPVDQKETKRHSKIYQIQKNRNPFIDHPDLVDQISNF